MGLAFDRVALTCDVESVKMEKSANGGCAFVGFFFCSEGGETRAPTATRRVFRAILIQFLTLLLKQGKKMKKWLAIFGAFLLGAA
ncbi:MAG: hypothetical protein IKK39_08000, partial [Thermoguttaceae bacterium]|nr:hypothetical protein [Thermoguttaceae bacterium]